MDWDSLARLHPDCSVFHTSAWARVLASTYPRHTPNYLRVHSARSGKTVALIPIMEVNSSFTGRRGVSLPFSDFCDPLIFAPEHWPERRNESEADLISHILELLAKLAIQRGWKHLELRSGECQWAHNDNDNHDHNNGDALTCGCYYTHQLDLTPGADSLKREFASSVRRAIRKGERSGIQVRFSHSKRSIMEFFRLHARTRRRQGLPPQSIAFFEAIHEQFMRDGSGFVAIAEEGRDASGSGRGRGNREGEEGNAPDSVPPSTSTRTIAAAVFLQCGKTAVYKFGASDERAWASRPNNLVMWRAIQFLTEQGTQSLHFGRTDLEHVGLRQFKLSWGTTEKKLTYHRFETAAGQWNTATIADTHSQQSVEHLGPNLSFNPNAAPDAAPVLKLKLAQRTGKHMGRLVKHIGHSAFRHFPLCLNRLAGALIYPHLD
ncbi:MAG: GNAT family N-acetyltransferase [Verrucomicrobiales bacterium]